MENLPPTAGNALHRARYPKTYHWDFTIEMLAVIHHAIQGGNWQRGGGEGDRPKPIERPSEIEAAVTVVDDTKSYDLDEIGDVMKRRRAKLRGETVDESQ